MNMQIKKVLMQQENDFMSKFEINGLFVLEISDDEIKTIFNDL